MLLPAAGAIGLGDSLSAAGGAGAQTAALCAAKAPKSPFSFPPRGFQRRKPWDARSAGIVCRGF